MVGPGSLETGEGKVREETRSRRDGVVSRSTEPVVTGMARHINESDHERAYAPTPMDKPGVGCGRYIRKALFMDLVSDCERHLVTQDEAGSARS